MPRKAKGANARPVQENPNTVSVKMYIDETTDAAVARTMLQPEFSGARTWRRVMAKTMGDSNPPVTALMHELSVQNQAVKRGDLSRLESLLTSEAHVLDALAADLIRLAYVNFETFDSFERLLRLAFKAQSQARATVETLAAMKNPPVMFAKQANLTTGPQQINNGVAPARETESTPNKLLEQTHGNWLEPVTASGAGRGDPDVAALGAVDRATKSRRQGAGRAQRPPRR